MKQFAPLLGTALYAALLAAAAQVPVVQPRRKAFSIRLPIVRGLHCVTSQEADGTLSPAPPGAFGPLAVRFARSMESKQRGSLTSPG